MLGIQNLKMPLLMTTGPLLHICKQKGNLDPQVGNLLQLSEPQSVRSYTLKIWAVLVLIGAERNCAFRIQGILACDPMPRI